MGESVLTPEGNLLGKTRRAVGVLVAPAVFAGSGGKGIRANIPKPVSGDLEAAKQLTTVDLRVGKPVESSLFSLTSLTPRITFQLEEGV